MLFTAEAIIKIIAMGFAIGQGTYLKDPWNWLDFFVVVTSLLAFLPNVYNVSGLRTFRLLRPLRSLSTMKSMRILVGTLMKSLQELGGVLSLEIFFFLIFAILGTAIFGGALNYRCRTTP